MNRFPVNMTLDPFLKLNEDSFIELEYKNQPKLLIYSMVTIKKSNNTVICIFFQKCSHQRIVQHSLQCLHNISTGHCSVRS